MHLADAFIQSDLHCIQVTVSLSCETGGGVVTEVRLIVSSNRERWLRARGRVAVAVSFVLIIGVFASFEL